MNDDTGVIDVTGPIAKRLTFETSKPDLPALGKFTREASLLVIDSQETYEFAANALVELKKWATAFEAKRMEMVRPLNQIKEVLQGWFNPGLSDAKEAERLIKLEMGKYEAEQRRLTAEHQAELDKKARELRDAELAKAAKLEKKNPEAAAVARENAAIIVAPTAASTFIQTKGTVSSMVWKAKLDGETDDELVAAKLRVVKFIAANQDYLYLLDINDTKCNALAKQVKKRMPVDGLVSYEEEIRSQRGGK